MQVAACATQGSQDTPERLSEGSEEACVVPACGTRHSGLLAGAALGTRPRTEKPGLPPLCSGAQRKTFPLKWGRRTCPRRDRTPAFCSARGICVQVNWLRMTQQQRPVKPRRLETGPLGRPVRDTAAGSQHLTTRSGCWSSGGHALVWPLCRREGRRGVACPRRCTRDVPLGHSGKGRSLPPGGRARGHRAAWAPASPGQCRVLRSRPGHPRPPPGTSGHIRALRGAHTWEGQQ